MENNSVSQAQKRSYDSIAGDEDDKTLAPKPKAAKLEYSSVVKKMMVRMFKIMILLVLQLNLNVGILPTS